MYPEPLGADERVYRRIPPTDPFFYPPNQVSTANFKLNKAASELGLSVYRASVVSADQVLAKPEAIPGSLLTACTVGEIRRLKNGKNEPLSLDVIVVDDEDNPGHAEIRSSQPGTLTSAASKALRDAFKLI